MQIDQQLTIWVTHIFSEKRRGLSYSAYETAREWRDEMKHQEVTGSRRLYRHHYSGYKTAIVNLPHYRVVVQLCRPRL